jgi:hypothetical protein
MMERPESTRIKIARSITIGSSLTQLNNTNRGLSPDYDMDAKIVALEQRRDKTKDRKQAMVQELLTGETRLA